MARLPSLKSLKSELEHYVEKVKSDEIPQFICETDNHVVLPLVVETLERSVSRIDQLAHHEFIPERQIQQEPQVPQVVPQPKNDSATKAEPPSPHKDVELSNTRLPLVSEVWNAKDPANYVRSRMSLINFAD